VFNSLPRTKDRNEFPPKGTKRVISSHQDFSERDYEVPISKREDAKPEVKDPKTCARLWPSLIQRF